MCAGPELYQLSHIPTPSCSFLSISLASSSFVKLSPHGGTHAQPPSLPLWHCGHLSVVLSEKIFRKEDWLVNMSFVNQSLICSDALNRTLTLLIIFFFVVVVLFLWEALVVLEFLL